MRVDSALTHHAQMHPDRTAVAVPGGERLTYRALDALISDRAAQMSAAAMAPGTPVAVTDRDPLAYLINFLAIVRSGLIAFCPPDGLPPSAVDALTARWGREPITLPDIFLMGMTSGSTGQPKALLRTHESWGRSFELMTRLFGLPGRMIVPGSLAYSAALIAALHTLHMGGTLWLLPSAPDAGWIDLIEQEGIDSAFLVPARLDSLATVAGGRICGRPLTIVTAGTKLDLRIRRRVTTLFPRSRLFEYYGSAEMGFVACMDPEAGEVRPESVGRLCAGVECQLRGDDGQLSAVGQIFVRSPYQFAGYAGKAGTDPGSEDSAGTDPEYEGSAGTDPGHEGQAGTDTEGWVTSGDWGRLDEDGFLHLIGRRADFINVGGAKLHTAEVEAVLQVHPQVQDATVVGLPDRVRGQVAGALVVGESGLTAPILRRWCSARLPRHAVPRRIRLVPALPRNPAGKVDRPAVLAWLAKDSDPQGSRETSVLPIPGVSTPGNPTPGNPTPPNPIQITVSPAALGHALGAVKGIPAILPATWWQFVQTDRIRPNERVILRAQSVEYFRPLVTGERLTCDMTVTRERQRGRQRYLTCTLDACSEGVLVARSVSELVVIT